jgi:hypothetical protein
VVFQECSPSLRGWFATAHHVLTDAALADVDAQFEQFAVNARSTPTGVLSTHPADQISGLAGDDGSSRLSVPNRSTVSVESVSSGVSNQQVTCYQYRQRERIPPSPPRSLDGCELSPQFVEILAKSPR